MIDLLIDGAPATLDDLTYLALVNYGAYTSFRVEAGAVRGLDLHLARLEASAIELFGETPGRDRLRELMRIAVAGQDSCWLRVSLFSPEVWARTPSWCGAPKVMTMTAAAPPPLADSLRLKTRTYARESAHLKHTAIFGLIHARRAARDDGFDDALFIGADGRVSEGSLWNIGFIQGDHIVWPEALMLEGVAQALIERGLASVGLTASVRPVTTSDLATFDAAFICNSATPVCPVAAIDAVTYDPAPAMMARLASAATFDPPWSLDALNRP